MTNFKLNYGAFNVLWRETKHLISKMNMMVGMIDITLVRKSPWLVKNIKMFMLTYTCVPLLTREDFSTLNPIILNLILSIKHPRVV